MKYSLIILSALILLSSCVSSKKFDRLLFEKNQIQSNYDQLLYVHEQNKRLQFTIDSLHKALSGRSNDLNMTKEGLSSLQASFNDITKRYNRLVEQNKLITNNSADQRNMLTKELIAKDELLNQRERTLDSLTTALTAKQQSLVDREQRLRDLQNILDQKNKALNSLQSTLQEALAGFSPSDLSIIIKDGKLYTTLSQDLLFASGSKQIDPKGIEALKKFGQVIKNNQDIEISVEGHTDTDGSEDLNWNLSADRAIAVTKVLISAGVDAKKIVPSGRAFHVPVAENISKEGKSKNRRTEIILTPKLNTLYNLISK